MDRLCHRIGHQLLGTQRHSRSIVPAVSDACVLLHDALRYGTVSDSAMLLQLCVDGPRSEGWEMDRKSYQNSVLPVFASITADLTGAMWGEHAGACFSVSYAEGTGEHCSLVQLSSCSPCALLLSSVLATVARLLPYVLAAISFAVTIAGSDQMWLPSSIKLSLRRGIRPPPSLSMSSVAIRIRGSGQRGQRGAGSGQRRREARALKVDGIQCNRQTQGEDQPFVECSLAVTNGEYVRVQVQPVSPQTAHTVYLVLVKGDGYGACHVFMSKQSLFQVRTIGGESVSESVLRCSKLNFGFPEDCNPDYLGYDHRQVCWATAVEEAQQSSDDMRVVTASCGGKLTIVTGEVDVCGAKQTPPFFESHEERVRCGQWSLAETACSRIRRSDPILSEALESALRLRGWIPNASWEDEPQSVKDADDTDDVLTSSVSRSHTDVTGGSAEVSLDSDGELSSTDCEGGAESDCNGDAISDEWGDLEGDETCDAEYDEHGSGDFSDGPLLGE